MIEFEYLISEIKRITSMSEESISLFVSSNNISYSGLNKFYLRYGRLPNKNECKATMLGLIDLN